MIYQARFQDSSRLSGGQCQLATNLLRETTFLEAGFRRSEPLRQALETLYAVVVSDLRYRPRARLEFKAWLEEQDRQFLDRRAQQQVEAAQELLALQPRIAELERAQQRLLAPFHQARQAYFECIWQQDYELNLLLDPVVTVHPDELSFEAFSKDESCYARLAVNYEFFSRVGSWECGTTNIDFSRQLHDAFQGLRSYRPTDLTISPSGLQVQQHKEKKIPLPQSWLQGFLQVQGVMSLGLSRFQLQPIDLYNLCRFLSRHRARHSPRALRFELQPGQPVQAVLEPWEYRLTLNPSQPYQGPTARSIRTWGRERLKVLTPLLAVARSIEVYLAGPGLPSIYQVDLGPVQFCLALSGWTDLDWTGQDRFALLTRACRVTAPQLQQVYEELRRCRRASATQLASSCNLSPTTVEGAASYLCQLGRAMVDLSVGHYRHRDLLAHPFEAQRDLAQAEQEALQLNPKAQAAKAIVESDNVRLIARRPVAGGVKLSGSAKGLDGQRVRPLVHLDHAGQIVEANCSCAWFGKHQLTQGPCDHILALRMLFLRGQDG